MKKLISFANRAARILAVLSVCFGAAACAGSSKLKWGASSFRKEPVIRVRVSGKGGQSAGILKLPMETYLAGVIGHEMSPRWPLEALKAQAVAARSYALYRMIESRNDGKPYDVYDSQADQVYKSAGAYHDHLKGIVDQTRGQVLWKDGRIVEAFFSSTCGGQTETAWGAGLAKDSPLTICGPDEFCESSPFRSWQMSIGANELAQRLNRAGHRVKEGVSVKVSERNPSGYANTVMIRDGRRKIEMPAKTFRNLMGNMRFKSLLFNMKEDGRGGYAFSGHGFGHGVGLCQYGARGMSLSGENYRKILQKYYPKMELRRIYN